ncbi:MFS transporter [Corynebacterium auriscanis]|uniref:MFS transporter n=1 Tax=Corynebacterium auriscanis TaxID=99807 RepID=UPI003CECD0A3
MQSRTQTTPLLLMAIATGLCAGGNYVNQPLLADFSATFGVSDSMAAATVTVLQGMYALGLILLVPLGDKFNRKTLALTLLGLAAAGHFLATISPTFWVLVIGLAIAGLFSTAAQVLVPYAADLAPEGQAGQAMGTVLSGLLAGILLARTVSGILGQIAGIRLPYATLTLALVLVGIALWRSLPSDTKPHSATESIDLRRVYSSMLELALTQPRVRTRSLMSALAFASVAAMMATMTALLAGKPFFLSTGVIGLIGLAGVVGALAARPVGKLGDQNRSGLATALSFGSLVIGWIIAIFGAHHLWAVIVAFLFVDFGLQSMHVTGMAIVTSTVPGARARLNSLYMFIYFLGPTAGSLIGAVAWHHWQWPGVVGAGLILVGILGVVYIWDTAIVRRAAATPDPAGGS